MDGLTPSYVPETGEVVLDGPPAGPAGEAGLIPVAGVELAFDRADGHLVRAIADVAGEAATELINRLFGAPAWEALRDLAEQADGPRRHAMAPVASLCAALSSLARLDAIRATGPVSVSSPWWAVEAAVLAEQAGLRARYLAEAGRVTSVLHDGQPRRSYLPGMDVAAEVAGLEETCLPSLHSILDPGLAPPEVFRPGLTPSSDLRVDRDTGRDCVVVQATLAPHADRAAAARWRARLVDPTNRLVLAEAGFRPDGSRILAELSRCPDEAEEAWIEVVDDPGRPVRSAKTHRIQRALRWADAALRAERAPAGIAPRASEADWAALAAMAWERCRRDWEAVGDRARATAVLAPRASRPGPACLAEILGD